MVCSLLLILTSVVLFHLQLSLHQYLTVLCLIELLLSCLTALLSLALSFFCDVDLRKCTRSKNCVVPLSGHGLKGVISIVLNDALSHCYLSMWCTVDCILFWLYILSQCYLSSSFLLSLFLLLLYVVLGIPFSYVTALSHLRFSKCMTLMWLILLKLLLSTMLKNCVPFGLIDRLLCKEKHFENWLSLVLSFCFEVEGHCVPAVKMFSSKVDLCPFIQKWLYIKKPTTQVNCWSMFAGMTSAWGKLTILLWCYSFKSSNIKRGLN